MLADGFSQVFHPPNLFTICSRLAFCEAKLLYQVICVTYLDLQQSVSTGNLRHRGCLEVNTSRPPAMASELVAKALVQRWINHHSGRVLVTFRRAQAKKFNRVQPKLFGAR